MSYDNNLTGILFPEDKKGNPSRPDYKGSLEIEGVRYWLSAWNKQTKKGEAISLKLEPAKKAAAALPSEPNQNDADFNDDVPW